MSDATVPTRRDSEERLIGRAWADAQVRERMKAILRVTS
jgi:hypothetical protein